MNKKEFFILLLCNISCIITRTYLLAIKIKSNIFYGLKIRLLFPLTGRWENEISGCDVWQPAYMRPVFTINNLSHWLFLTWAISVLRDHYHPNKVITVNLVWRHVHMTGHVF
jgi:hypothetical protein